MKNSGLKCDVRDMNPLISVIIPVFNPGKYLKRCLESLINQTYSNIEILLVDDGSSDGSDVICDEYRVKNPRITVIHQENSGVSIARNRALDIAKGVYISFVDADDYVTTDFIESLYKGISENSVDLSICGIEKIGGINIQSGKYDDDYKNEEILLDKSGIVERDDLWFHAIDSNLIGGYLWNKLYKRSLLVDYRFDPTLSIGEDMVCLVRYLQRIDNAYYISKSMYKYQINESSALNNTTATNESELIKKIESSLKAANLVQDYTMFENRTIKNYVAYRSIRSSLWCMFRMIIANVFDKDIACKIKKIVNENYIGYKVVGYGSMVQRVAVVVLRYSPRMLFVCGRIAMTMFPSKMYSYSRDR